MPHALVIRVRFHDGRYHGAGDWPPSPARLFQALVAAAGLNGQLPAMREGLEWLEKQPSAPIIATPNIRQGQRVMFYMPNNDLDKVQGDPRRVAEIRTAKKFFSPRLFDASTSFLYIWPDVASADEAHAQAIVSLAEQLYQLGRGIDMAWAWGELVDPAGGDEALASHTGPVYRPSAGGGGITLLCPQPGSLASTVTRYQGCRRRFEVGGKGNKVKLTFRQPSRPIFRPVAYESPPSRFVYETRALSHESSLASWPLVDVSKLVVNLRNGAVERLENALPASKAEIARVLVGRKPDGTKDGSTTDRARIVPLPSIGHLGADRAIRRVLVEVPAGCSLQANDVAWAFSGLETIDSRTGDADPVVLTPATSDSMLRHYGIGEDAGGHTWRTVTPAALPESARRRRIDPARKLVEAKGGAERILERQRAATAVLQALRHADVRVPVESIRVQREPFESRGDRVEAFAAGTRFPKERLWHVEIRFIQPVSGPVIVGDGRFLGLGVMAPVRDAPGVHVFAIEAGLPPNPDPVEVVRAFRRAVMARVQQELNDSLPLPPFFSGHEPDGTPAQSERHPHLGFLFDARKTRLLVLAPHCLDRRAASREETRNLEILGRAMCGLRELRAGSAGLLNVCAVAVDSATDSLFAGSRVWESATLYQVTRHVRGRGAHEVLAIDVRAECRRRGLPEPLVWPLECRGVSGAGLEGRVRLEFEVVVQGPIILGKRRYSGGGVFSCHGGARD